MFDMVDFAVVKRLIEEVEALEDRLTGNELELYRSIKARYEEPAPGSFDDKVCLEVILRNVKIREGYKLEPEDTAGRVIDLPRKSGSDEGD